MIGPAVWAAFKEEQKVRKITDHTFFGTAATVRQLLLIAVLHDKKKGSLTLEAVGGFLCPGKRKRQSKFVWLCATFPTGISILYQFESGRTIG